jgi:argininosuccinate lyase
MKLWQKNISSLKEVEIFTVGNDRQLDMYLAPFDVLGSLAHVQMLQTINLLTGSELKILQEGLRDIYKDIDQKIWRYREKDSQCPLQE